MEEPMLHGLVSTFREDGSLLAEVSYDQGVRHGPYRDYWSNGRVSLEGQYAGGLQEGEWRFYNPDGSLWEILRFEVGREIIEWDEFFSSPHDTPTEDGS